ACNALVADGCVEPVDCGAVCAMVPESAHAFVAYCVERRDGCQLPEECDAVLEDDPDAECQDACDSMLFFDCIDAPQHSDCRSLCGSVDEDTRDTFTACAGDGICSDASCYEVLGGEAEGGGDGGSLQALCEAGCDDMMFWECIDAAAHASCRSHCAEADDSSMDTFLGCLGIDPMVGGIGTCEDSACYDVFVG